MKPQSALRNTWGKPEHPSIKPGGQEPVAMSIMLDFYDTVLLAQERRDILRLTVLIGLKDAHAVYRSGDMF